MCTCSTEYYVLREPIHIVEPDPSCASHALSCSMPMPMRTWPHAIRLFFLLPFSPCFPRPVLGKCGVKVKGLFSTTTIIICSLFSGHRALFPVCCSLKKRGEKRKRENRLANSPRLTPSRGREQTPGQKCSRIQIILQARGRRSPSSPYHFS